MNDDPLDTREQHVGDPAGHERGSGQHGHRDGHGGHGDHAAKFRDRFWISAVLSVPVVLYSHMIQEWFGYTAPSSPDQRCSRPCSAPRSSCTAAGRS